jgi:AAA+ ATPase superfamily predicted ATPase
MGYNLSMNKNKLGYQKYPAFINREIELRYLRENINISPESILFIHGPKSSGKTTLKKMSWNGS